MVIFWVGREQVYENKANCKLIRSVYCFMYMCSYSCKLDEWMVVKWNSFEKNSKDSMEKVTSITINKFRCSLHF